MPGKDIAIFGRRELFRSVLEAGLVDRIEVGVMPVLLGDGIPLTVRRIDGTRSSAEPPQP